MNQENNKIIREAAELLIENSHNSHEDGVEDAKCFGCRSMRVGLEILSLLGDPTVFRA